MEDSAASAERVLRMAIFGLGSSLGTDDSVGLHVLHHLSGHAEVTSRVQAHRAKGVPAYQITTGTACHLDAHMVPGGVNCEPTKDMLKQAWSGLEAFRRGCTCGSWHGFTSWWCCTEKPSGACGGLI